MPVLPLTGRRAPEPSAFARPDAIPAEGAFTLDLDNTADVAALAPLLWRIALIRIPFPGFADGRGFSLARRLRDLGYAGRLRAAGPLIPDQRAALLGSGFDEVELPDAHLCRQGGPEAWAAPAPDTATPFRRRLQRPARPEATAA
jgi:uncharacterized protein (DUF934 family)